MLRHDGVGEKIEGGKARALQGQEEGDGKRQRKDRALQERSSANMRGASLNQGGHSSEGGVEQSWGRKQNQGVMGKRGAEAHCSLQMRIGGGGGGGGGLS